jgi:hypothetical protein
MDVNVTSLQGRAKVEAKSYLEQLLSEGARKLLQAAIENEVAVYLQSQSGRRSESGERSVVRNGHRLPPMIETNARFTINRGDTNIASTLLRIRMDD